MKSSPADLFEYSLYFDGLRFLFDVMPLIFLQSHQIGPGPEYERVKFNTSGRSPLIAHYLHLRQLKDFHQPGKKVRRTEIVKLPAPGPTYRQLINNTLSMSDALSKEYQRLV